MTGEKLKNGYISDVRHKRLKVVIVGGGLVGSLSTSFFAKRGHDVTLYEYRQDIRTSDLVKGRSINLAMSARARAALREVGLEHTMVESHGIPMRGRMIHQTNGKKYEILYDPLNKQCIYSVGRKHLNEVLLTAAEKYPNVKTVFQHKLIAADLEEGNLSFLRTTDKELVNVKADLIVGADGAYSSVRKEFMKQPLFDFSQKYIEHGYLELCIPPTQTGEFAMEPNFLHIWPRGTFMMIALPNQDHSWTVTLFMPFQQFDKLSTPELLLNFFREYFPDSISLMTEERLVADFYSTKPSSLVSIKCNPYHVSGKALLLGDAAHAMVPFYGQGMNAGFEDCSILDQLMTRYNDDLLRVLPSFSEVRNPDAEAICDLAMYNYIEMRDLVNRTSFLVRKKFDTVLYRLFPTKWVPLYNSVTFSDMAYQECINNKKWQDQVINSSIRWFGVVSCGALVSCLVSCGLQLQQIDVGSLWSVLPYQ